MARAPAWLMVLVAAGAPTLVTAGPSPLPQPPAYAQIGTLTAEQGRQIIRDFRSAGLSQPAYFEFTLRSLPRRGAEQDFPGRLWAGRDDQGPVWRIELQAGGRHFLVQDGPRAAVWRTSGGSVDRAPMGEPLVPGLDITPFDLLMPYFYWPNARPAGVERVLGRPADVFVFLPPAGFDTQVPGLAEVRAYLDGEYHAPLQVESLGPDGRVFKTLSLVDLKRVAGQVLPKDIDVRDEATRNKTRFSLTAAALGVDLSPALFTPASLPEPVAPPAGKIERF